MMLWLVVMYFMCVCGLAAWALLPAWRVCDRDCSGGTVASSVKSTQVGQGTGVSKAGERSRLGVLGRPASLVLLALILIGLPPGLVWWTRSGLSLGQFDDSLALPPESALVGALLQGEQLIPPQPLPPALFTTPEVVAQRPQLVLASADRRWDQLDPTFVQRLLWVYKVMREEHGYEMVLLEGYRSPQRQTMLFCLGPAVTNAGAWQSYHQYGLAADSAFLRDSKLVISERDPWAMRGYQLYGQLAARAGLVWGGHWQNADLGHVELRSRRLSPPLKRECPKGVGPIN